VSADLVHLEAAPAELVDVGAAGDRDPRLVYLASLSSEKSRRAMSGALERAAAVVHTTADRLPWAALRYQHTQAIRAGLEERYAPATVNHALAALRGVLREAVRLGQMSADDAARASDLKPAKGERLPAGRALAREELHRLVEACDVAVAAGARDAAMVALLWGCGLRRAELVGLDLAHYLGAARELDVLGKGNRQRRAYVAPAVEHLERWIERRGPREGPLFLPIDRAGVIQWRRLSDQAVLWILRRLAGRAGVTRFSPHDLRRTFVGDMLDAGADIAVVQRLAGHAQVTTTQRYDRRGERAARAAAELLQKL
jgi:site-specific recombinase XerD